MRLTTATCTTVRQRMEQEALKNEQPEKVVRPLTDYQKFLLEEAEAEAANPSPSAIASANLALYTQRQKEAADLEAEQIRSGKLRIL